MISIHALREEGDSYTAESSIIDVGFLSTPSARRATAVLRDGNAHKCISIHALREEGDKEAEPCSALVINFYPRPPRGGRRCTAQMIDPELVQFLSTPSARRATVSYTLGPLPGVISIHALREEGDTSRL